jgi:hypothetical protein
MLKFDTEIYLDPSLSKKVLESIRDQKKIDYKTLKIFYLRKRIQNLEKKFQLKLKNNLKLNYKNYLFWQLVKEEYNLENLDIKKKKIGNKKNEVNVNFTYFIKFLGFNPSLLSLLIFSKEIKKIVKLNNFFETLQNKIDLENINTSERIKFINLLEKREINIVTPLCPDYEHVKVGNNLFKYTFKKLGSGIGMMGTRFLSIYSDLLPLFLKEKVNLKIHLLYGDFEGFSKINCNRLKETEASFLKKIDLSSQKLSQKIDNKKTCGAVVKNLADKKKWKNRVKKNIQIIKNEMKKDLEFRIKVLEIAESRAHLYASWFPALDKSKYLEIVIEQGAEYTTMGDLFYKKYKNLCVLAFDHSKMKIFYTLNNSFPVLYGRKRY